MSDAIITIPGLKKIEERQDIIIQRLMAMAQTANSDQYWFNLEDACKLKGVNYNTVKNNWYYKPKGGKHDSMIHGVKMWNYDSIKEWIFITDSNRKEYLERFDFFVADELQEKWSKE